MFMDIHGLTPMEQEDILLKTIAVEPIIMKRQRELAKKKAKEQQED
jgi:hypothetical protein